MSRNGHTLTLVHWGSGDWVAVYLDGQLVYEGHSVPDHTYEILINTRGPIASMSQMYLRLTGEDEFIEVKERIDQYTPDAWRK